MRRFTPTCGTWPRLVLVGALFWGGNAMKHYLTFTMREDLARKLMGKLQDEIASKGNVSFTLELKDSTVKLHTKIKAGEGQIEATFDFEDFEIYRS
jgi:hypothetical protein